MLVLPWQPLCSSVVGGRHHLNPKYDVDMTTQYWVTENLACIPHVTTWSWLSRDATCVINPCAKLEVDVTYSSRVSYIYVDARTTYNDVAYCAWGVPEDAT